MKIIGAFYLLSIIAVNEALKPNDWCSGQYLRNALARCGSIYGATEADYNDFMYLNPARNGNMKCYRACVFNACQDFNADGSFAANFAYTKAFTLTRLNSQHWDLIRDVTEYCVNTSPAITYEHSHKSYTLCDKTEDLLLCLKANLPAGTSFEGIV